MEPGEPNLPQRMLNEFSPSPAMELRTDSAACLQGVDQGRCPPTYIRDRRNRIASINSNLAKDCKNDKPNRSIDGRSTSPFETPIGIFPEHECYVEVFADCAALYFKREEPVKVEY